MATITQTKKQSTAIKKAATRKTPARKTAGSKKKPRKTIVIHLSANTMERLYALAKKMGKTFAQLINFLIEDGLRVCEEQSRNEAKL